MSTTAGRTDAIAVSPRRAPGAVRYSICTLVTDRAEHAAMLASFRSHGFSGSDCEHLYIDNSQSNSVTAYDGLARLIEEARGDYVVLCHQDVRLLSDGRAELDRRLAELDARDPHWALAGNAGGTAPGRLAMRISDPHGRDRTLGTLPERVMSLDENFVVLRRSCRIGPSHDLTGFHFYGADLCLAADVMGYSAYVIDFHLEHLSDGRISPAFYAARNAFRRKWSRALRARWMQTTCGFMLISGGRLGQALAGVLQGYALRIAMRLPSARGWPEGKRPREAAP